MITLAFLFLFCICILCCFLTQKHPFGCFFGVFGFGTVLFFGASQIPRVTRRGSSSGGGQICQNAEIPPSFMSLPCIFCKRMHLQYIEEPFLCQHLGALPQTPTSLAAPQGQAVKTQPPDPVAKCWVGSKASRVKCTASPPLTPLHLRESSRGRFRKRNLKHAKECSIQQRRGFACGVCRWKRRFGCSRNSAVSAARFERFSRTGRTRPALARPAFSRWLLENDRLREQWPCQWLNVLYFPFSETSPSKTIRSGWSWKPVKACEATACGLALQVGGDPTLCGKGAGGFPLHPCHVANAGVGSAHGVGKTLGGRAVGDSVP